MGKHRKPARKWAPYVTAGVALPAAAALGVAHAGDVSFSSAADLLATSIFVDGTKSPLGNEQGTPPFRMADSFQGRYSDGDDAEFDEQFVFYPRSLGPATGLGDPTYDESEGLATQAVVDLVKAAKDDDGYNGQTIYVVGYSQGAGAATMAIPELEAQGLAENVEFVLAANPRRNDGGLLTRIPAGVYLPLFGVSFGEGTMPEQTKVVQVTKQFDGIGDSPNYLFNAVSNVNSALGSYYLHPDYYQNVDPTPDANRTDAIVTKSADGNVTDVLILVPDGQLPLTRPLLDIGVPQDLVSAMDPFLRSVIETGYNRPTGPNSFASEPVPFQLVPPPQKWLPAVQSVVVGALQTTERLVTLGQPDTSIDDDDDSAARVAETEEVAPDPSKKDDEEPLEVVDAVDAGPNKVEPPKHRAGGWRPGDLLRSIFGPKPKKDDSAQVDEPTDTSTPDAPTADPGTATDADSEASATATG